MIYIICSYYVEFTYKSISYSFLDKTSNDIDQSKSPQPEELGCYRSSTNVEFIRFHLNDWSDSRIILNVMKNIVIDKI